MSAGSLRAARTISVDEMAAMSVRRDTTGTKESVSHAVQPSLDVFSAVQLTSAPSVPVSTYSLMKVFANVVRRVRTSTQTR